MILSSQYYTEVQDKRYVDLGLQTHRIKCRVHNDFKYDYHVTCEPESLAIVVDIISSLQVDTDR